MFHKSLLGLLATAAVALVPAQTNAWGKTGHRVIGQIAERYMSADAKREVHEILGTESLAEASTWADFMRQHPGEFWQREASPYHYVTIPQGQTYRETGAPPQGDAITALSQFAKTLQGEDSSLEEKQLALRFIIHIVGDLHQPLHAGNGKDRGGNQFRVVYFGEASNLHRVWDEQLIDGEQLSYTEWTEWLQKQITDSDRANWWNPDPIIWVEESAAIRDTIYPDEQILSWDYPYAHIGTVKQRLKMGGVRLAAYLDEVLTTK